MFENLQKQKLWAVWAGNSAAESLTNGCGGQWSQWPSCIVLPSVIHAKPNAHKNRRAQRIKEKRTQKRFFSFEGYTPTPYVQLSKNNFANKKLCQNGRYFPSEFFPLQNGDVPHGAPAHPLTKNHSAEKQIGIGGFPRPRPP